MTLSETSPRVSRLRHGGFTLVEVLVVMALLSLVMLALGSSLRTVAQTQERVDARLAAADEWRVAVAFVRAALGRVSSRKTEASIVAEAGRGQFLFVGGADAVMWVGVMPARFGAGGRYFFRLAVEPLDGAGMGLVIRFKPWEDVSSFPEWAKAESRVLVANVTSVSLRYQGGVEGLVGEWDAPWSVRDRLPDRVMLEVSTSTSEWPPLIVPLRQLPVGDARSVTFSAGGGRR